MPSQLNTAMWKYKPFVEIKYQFNMNFPVCQLFSSVLMKNVNSGSSRSTDMLGQGCAEFVKMLEGEKDAKRTLTIR